MVRKRKKGQGQTSEREWEIKPVRPHGPGRKRYRRGSLMRIGRLAGTPVLMAAATADYERDKLAPGSRQAQLYRVAFWSSRAEELGIEPFPLDAAKIRVYITLQYSTVVYSTVQLSTVQYSRVQHSTVQ